MIVHDEWRRKRRHYPGNILIDLCPVETTLNEISNPEWMRAKMCRIETAHVTMDIFSPQCYDLSLIQFWDNYRFYFCPRRFPPPYDVNNMWDCESFDHLRWYIKHCSEKGCSPVYYNGGNEGLTRRFRCALGQTEMARGASLVSLFHVTCFMDITSHFIAHRAAK